MKLRYTIKLKKFLEIKSPPTLTRKIFSAIISFLEKNFGTPVLIEIPEYLQDQDPETWKGLEMAYKLKELGIVDNIVKTKGKTDEPFMHLYVIVPASKKLIAAGAGGGGYDFFDEKKALWSTLGEAVERYSWFSDFYEGKVVKTSYRALGDKALNIFKLAGFTAEQKKGLAKYIFFDKDTIFGWIEVNSLTSEKRMFCPVQLLSASYFRTYVREPVVPDREEPLLRWSITTGAACGQSLEEALVKGIMETIERDAFMITFLNKISPPRVNLDELAKYDEDIEKIIKKLRRYNLEFYVVQLPTDFPVWVSATFIVDRSGHGPAFSIGTRASLDLKISFIDSLKESYAVRDWQMRNRVKEIDHKKINPQNIRTRIERLAYWAHSENLPKLEFLFKGKVIKLDLKRLKKISEDDKGEKARKEYYRKSLRYLKRKIREKDYEGCYIDLSTPELRKLNMWTVFVLIPELQPMSLIDTVHYLGGPRLKEVPRKFGYEPAEKLNEDPQPLP